MSHLGKGILGSVIVLNWGLLVLIRGASNVGFVNNICWRSHENFRRYPEMSKLHLSVVSFSLERRFTRFNYESILATHGILVCLEFRFLSCKVNLIGNNTMFFCGERRDIFTLRGKRSVCDLGLYFLTFSGISQKSAGTDHRDVTKEEKRGNSSWRLGIWKIPRIFWLPCWQKKRVAFGQKWNSIKPKNCPHHVSSLKKQNSIFCWTALWVKFNMIREDLCHAWSSFQIIGARGFISSIYRQAFFLQQIQRKRDSHKRKGEEEGW